MSTLRLPLAVATAAAASLLPAGAVEAARYALAIIAERRQAMRWC